MTKLFVGLGNPGKEYEGIRHNVGFLVAQKAPKGLRIAKSESYMNSSGEYVKKILSSSKVSPENLYVIHDDLDLPLGTWKIQFGRGPKDNGGINSIENELGTKDFWRVRVGIDNRHPENREEGNAYVMSQFTDTEEKIIDNVISEICKKLATL